MGEELRGMSGTYIKVMALEGVIIAALWALGRIFQ
jgi:hypothetical protein